MQSSTRVSPSNRKPERQTVAAQAVTLRVARRPRIFRRRANWLLVSGTIIIGLVVLMALVGAIHPPQDPVVMHPADRGQGPSQTYWMGTDQYGRDILSRLLSAAAVALLVGAGSSALGLVIGAPLGATAGFVRGWSDEAVMRVMDALFAFPATLLAIALAGPLAAVFMVGHIAAPGGGQEAGPWSGITMLAIVGLGLVGLVAPIATTILGIVSISQIRRSCGRLYGMGLALFDALVFPLLALDCHLVLACCLAIGHEWGSLVLPIALGVLIAVAMDVLIVWLVNRAVRRPVPGAAAAS